MNFGTNWRGVVLKLGWILKKKLHKSCCNHRPNSGFLSEWSWGTSQHLDETYFDLLEIWRNINRENWRGMKWKKKQWKCFEQFKFEPCPVPDVSPGPKQIHHVMNCRSHCSFAMIFRLMRAEQMIYPRLGWRCLFPVHHLFGFSKVQCGISANYKQDHLNWWEGTQLKCTFSVEATKLRIFLIHSLVSLVALKFSLVGWEFYRQIPSYIWRLS